MSDYDFGEVQEEREETPEERKARLKAAAEERGRLMRTYLKTSTAGLEVGLSVIVGALLGFFADTRLGTRPWGMLLGLFFGCVAAGKKIWKIIQEQNREAAREAAAASTEESGR